MDKALKDKLHPRQFPKASGKWVAIVGYLLEESFTDPAIEDMAVTSDGMVLAQIEGDVGMNDFVGSMQDVQRNWTRYLDAAQLTDDERLQAERVFREKLRQA